MTTTKKKPAPKSTTTQDADTESSKKRLSDDEMANISGGTHGGIQPGVNANHTQPGAKS